MNRSKESNTSDEAKIIVSKNKNGLIGDVPVHFLSEYRKFEDFEKPSVGWEVQKILQKKLILEVLL